MYKRYWNFDSINFCVIVRVLFLFDTFHTKDTTIEFQDETDNSLPFVLALEVLIFRHFVSDYSTNIHSLSISSTLGHSPCLNLSTKPEISRIEELNFPSLQPF